MFIFPNNKLFHLIYLHIHTNNNLSHRVYLYFILLLFSIISFSNHFINHHHIHANLIYSIIYVSLFLFFLITINFSFIYSFITPSLFPSLSLSLSSLPLSLYKYVVFICTALFICFIIQRYVIYEHLQRIYDSKTK